MINFKGRHFDDVIILMSVRWYLVYPLSYRHINELMKERGVDVDHSTINRWVIKYSPLLEREFTKRYKSQVGLVGVWMKRILRLKAYGIISIELSIK